MLTPSGRFEPNDRICLSMSDFHPESWNPAWNVGTMLVGLVSFMVTDEFAAGATDSTTEEKVALAAKSAEFNSKIVEIRGLFDRIPRN